MGLPRFRNTAAFCRLGGRARSRLFYSVVQGPEPVLWHPRGAEPAQASCWATYAHATAGQRLAPRFGRTGYLARELLDEVAYTIGTI